MLKTSAPRSPAPGPDQVSSCRRSSVGQKSLVFGAMRPIRLLLIVVLIAGCGTNTPKPYRQLYRHWTALEGQTDEYISHPGPLDDGNCIVYKENYGEFYWELLDGVTRQEFPDLPSAEKACSFQTPEADEVYEAGQVRMACPDGWHLSAPSNRYICAKNPTPSWSHAQ